MIMCWIVQKLKIALMITYESTTEVFFRVNQSMF